MNINTPRMGGEGGGGRTAGKQAAGSALRAPRRSPVLTAASDSASSPWF